MKIFNMNDCDWWAGENAEECLEGMKNFSGYGEDEIKDMIEDGYPVALTEEEINRLKFVPDPYDSPNEGVRTFKEELRRMIDAKEQFPCFFASTEY